MSTDSYAGDLTPLETWNLLKSNERAVLVDVRTDAEFSYVGVVDLSDLGKQAIYASWILFPGMTANPGFTKELENLNFNKDQPLIFLCRSGVRSVHSAVAITALGYSKCYNVLGGFEGDKDDTKHRGTKNGWKVDGLPWVQK